MKNMRTFFSVVASRRVWGLVEKDWKYFYVVCILSTWCIQFISVKYYPLQHFHHSLGFDWNLWRLIKIQWEMELLSPSTFIPFLWGVSSFSPNSCFWWCIFCPNTYYHSIWTPVRSSCSRMWSGSEGHKLMNISLPHFVCHPTHIFLAIESRKEVGAWFVYREGRIRQVETGHPNTVGAAV